MAKYKNPFDALLAPTTKTAKIEALGGAEIEYRLLTVGEADDFRKRLIKGYNAETGTPELDLSGAVDVKYDKIATMLVKPQMTADDLRNLAGDKAEEVIEELIALLDGHDEPETDEEGN